MASSGQNLASELERLLVAARIFDLRSYVWLNPDDTDPEFQGLAAWELAPPWDLLRDDAKPTDLQKRLVVAGTDFEGSLGAARLSMGLLLLHEQPGASREWGNQEFFWLHRISVLALLKIAADHIQRYMALSWRGYGFRGGSWKSWEQPFLDAPMLARAANLKEQALQHALGLAAIAPRLVAHAKERDVTVHELTTQSAREIKSILESWEPATLSEAEKAQQWAQHYEEIVAAARADADEKMARRVVLREALHDWYGLVVDTANHVFFLEHALRMARGSA